LLSGCRKSEDVRPETEVRRRKSEDGRPETEVRRRKSEDGRPEKSDEGSSLKDKKWSLKYEFTVYFILVLNATIILNCKQTHNA
jgi:hypothetical protein